MLKSRHMKVRVRIAPSPTGIPHLGNTRTALFNYVFAKHYGGDFILRIEDTDQARIVPGAKEAILAILSWLGLLPDETYVQSERLTMYKGAAEKLIKGGFAREDEGAIRFVAAEDGQITWTDGVGNKPISFQAKDIEDFVILKSGGFPTYHLANVVDDHEMGITHVIRGEEWISSTPKHILLYKALGWEVPVFAHLPLILGPDKTKLSKRHGAQSVLDYKEQGYLKEAIINFLMLLGWTHPEQKEIFSLSEAVKLFDLKDVHLTASIFDTRKIEWLNGEYIRQAKLDELVSSIKYYVSSIKEIDEGLLYKIIPLAQSRMKTLKEFNELVTPFFEDLHWQLSDEEKTLAKRLRTILASIDWNVETLRTRLLDFCKQENIKLKTIYTILTGKDRGLPLSEMFIILGKERILKKLGEV